MKRSARHACGRRETRGSSSMSVQQITGLPRAACAARAAATYQPVVHGGLPRAAGIPARRAGGSAQGAPGPRYAEHPGRAGDPRRWPGAAAARRRRMPVWMRRRATRRRPRTRRAAERLDLIARAALRYPCGPACRCPSGEVAEWSKALAWKVSNIPKGVRGFESLPLRQTTGRTLFGLEQATVRATKRG